MLTKLTRGAVFFVTSALLAQAQPVTAPLRTHIRAFGEGRVSGAPDQAQVDLAVVTQAATAQDAAAQNANQTTAVLTQLRQLLGAAANIRTVNYSLSPNYNYPRDGGAPTLIGFTVSNTVEVKVGDLTLPGKIIDTAIQAGANRVDGLGFTLKDDLPLRTEALRAAALQARTRANAIAMGAGVRLGNVISVEETSTQQIVPRMAVASVAGGAPTPVQAGTIEISANVVLDIEIVP